MTNEYDDLPPPPADLPPEGNNREHGADVDRAAGISKAKGQGTDALGEQVHPATMTSEADGHRTLAKPVTDPGPYVPEGGMGIKHPDPAQGEHRYSDANDTFQVTMRTSTGHDEGYGRPGGPTHDTVDLAPDLAITGAASDAYNKEQGKNLTDVAQRKSAEGREPAPLHE